MRRQDHVQAFRPRTKRHHHLPASRQLCLVDPSRMSSARALSVQLTTRMRLGWTVSHSAVAHPGQRVLNAGGMTSPEDLKQLAPTGQLRGGVVTAPAASAFFAIKDKGE